MTPDDLFKTSEQLALSVRILSQQRGMSQADMMAVATMAMLDLLSINGSAIATVERLRDLADMVERRIMLH